MRSEESPDEVGPGAGGRGRAPRSRVTRLRPGDREVGVVVRDAEVLARRVRAVDAVADVRDVGERLEPVQEARGARRGGRSPRRRAGTSPPARTSTTPAGRRRGRRAPRRAPRAPAWPRRRPVARACRASCPSRERDWLSWAAGPRSMPCSAAIAVSNVRVNSPRSSRWGVGTNTRTPSILPCEPPCAPASHPPSVPPRTPGEDPAVTTARRPRGPVDLPLVRRHRRARSCSTSVTSPPPTTSRPSTTRARTRCTRCGCGCAPGAGSRSSPRTRRRRRSRAAPSRDALVDQARDAVARVQAAGLLVRDGGGHGHRVRQPARRVVARPARRGRAHGGARRAAPADVVVDCFGLMHAADQAAGLAERGGRDGARRHAAAAVPHPGRDRRRRRVERPAPRALRLLLDAGPGRGCSPRSASRSRTASCSTSTAARCSSPPVAAASAGPRTRPRCEGLVERETALGVTDPDVVAGLEEATATQRGGPARAPRAPARAPGGRCSATPPRRAPCRCSTAPRIGPDLLPAVADGSPGKQGRRFPGVGVPDRGAEEVVRPPSRRGRPLRHRPARRDALAAARGRGWRRRWVVVDPTVARAPGRTT